MVFQLGPYASRLTYRVMVTVLWFLLTFWV
nr:MAG TPA: hypothetical protein [Caudoviricetes sp.]